MQRSHRMKLAFRNLKQHVENEIKKRTRRGVTCFQNLTVEDSNTIQDRQNEYVAKWHLRKRVYSEYFPRLKDMINIMKAKSHRAREHYARVFVRRSLEFYRAWVDYTKRRRNQKKRYAMARKFWRRNAINRVAKRFLQVRAVKRWERNVTKQVIRIHVRGTKRHHVYLWKMWLSDLKFNRAANALRNTHLLRMSFRMWNESVRDRKYGYMLNLRATRLQFLRETRRYFRAWKLEFLLSRKMSCRYLTRLFLRSNQERVFAKWCAFTFNSNRVLRAITQIQARVRGDKAREYAEDHRTDVIWAANKINAFARQRLGKKELRRRKRMFRLKEYKNVLEPECEQMEIEDRMSNHLRFEWDCAVSLQRVWRGKMARVFAYVVKQKAVIDEELRKKKESERAVKRAEKRKLKREELHQKMEAMARRLQCLWRTKVARRAFLSVIVSERRNRAARTIQRNVRGRAARLENAARLRLKRTQLEIFRRRYQTASLLRRFGLKTRKWQGRVRKVLDFFGLDPDTFQLSSKDLIREVREDLSQFTHEVGVKIWNLRQRFRLGKHSNGPLELLQRKRVGDEIKPGVSVKILHRQSRFRGETGYVVNIKSRGEYGAQVVVRIDRDGRILRFPLTYMWGRWNRGFPSLLKLNENQDTIRVIPALNEISRAELLVRGDEEKEQEKDRRAAVFVQRMWRGRKGRAKASEAYEKRETKRRQVRTRVYVVFVERV